MLVVFHTDTPGTESLCRDTLQKAGARFVKEMDHYDIVRSDALIVLVSFKGDTFEDIVAAHPYNRKVLVTSVSTIPDNNTIVVNDIEDLPERLLSIFAQERKSALPVMTTSKKHNRRRIEVHKSKCPFCAKDIGEVVLGMQKHLTACKNYLNRPVVYGHMVTIRQPNGRSKGSVLTIHLPSALTVNDKFYEPGLHVIVEPKAIKILNAVLRDTYRYMLDVENIQANEDEDESILCTV